MKSKSNLLKRAIEGALASKHFLSIGFLCCGFAGAFIGLLFGGFKLSSISFGACWGVFIAFVCWIESTKISPVIKVLILGLCGACVFTLTCVVGDLLSQLDLIFKAIIGFGIGATTRYWASYMS